VTAPEIAAALGGARRSGQWWRCICPVHGSRTGRSLSLSLRDHPRGLAVRCHAGCSRDDVVAELRRLGLLAERSGGNRTLQGAPPDHDRTDTARRIAMAQRIWDSAHDARGTQVVQYLAGRSINLPIPRALRYAPALRRPGGTNAPAMVARIDDIDGALIGVHRTWLDRDDAGQWHRRDRASLGPITGGAVRLAPAAETLLIGEGVETTLAGTVATGLPGWAALSTSGMTALLLPPIVRAVIILADHDVSGAGERAARTAAARSLAAGRRVRIAMPSQPGWDMADVLLAGRLRLIGGRDAA
jgi:putative DNA primase/helicase